MLTRTHVALDSAAAKKRMRSILDGLPDLSISMSRGTRPKWDRLGRVVSDIHLVSRSLIPDPAPLQIATLRELPDAPELVVLAPGEDGEDRAQLLAAGCYAVLDSFLDDDLLRDALQALFARQRDEASARLTLPQTLEEPRLSDFVFNSPAMHAFMEVVQRVVPSDTTLLITGETGVGKERLAQAIHAEGPRSTGPFVAVNCGAIPEALLESELFGHQEGAFTGATRARRGWFELAHGGTIFLDEIGEMPVHLQVKLLRVLQTRDVLPVGSEKSIRVDVRVMAATNRDLEEETSAKKFRTDLYYRLSVVTLDIPPLRERTEDIPALIERYINYFQSKIPTTATSISKEAVAALTNYSWPGNVRELANVIERALLLCGGDKITVRDLPETIAEIKVTKGKVFSDLEQGAENWIGRPLADVRAEFVESLEKNYLRALLESTKGSINETAARAGMNNRNLFEKMRKYALRKEDFRGR